MPAHAGQLDSDVAQALTAATFTRATESHECGYPEYDPWIEDLMPVLTYPSGAGSPESPSWLSGSSVAGSARMQ